MKKKNKKENKQKTTKKKGKIIGVSIVVILLILIIITTLLVLYTKKEVKNIKTSYNQYIKIKKDTNIYDKNNKVLGKIYKNTELELVKLNKITTKNKNFQIKDTNYYIYYKATKKIKNINKDKQNNNYIVLNKNIKTNKKVTLYKNNKKVITLNNGINLPIQYISNNTYYVYYLNKLLEVKKSNKIKEINHENTKENSTNQISILLYDTINNTCTNNENCTTTETFKNQINKLLENNYYTITNEEYENYLNNNLRLKNKALLILTNNESDTTKNISKELNINIETPSKSDLVKTNEKTVSNTYQIKSYSTIENILKMANGEKVVETPPKKQTNYVQGVPVLNYHFFYDPTLGEECYEGICLTTQKFREHLEYLKNNNFKVLTMNEFVKWIYGEIDIPEKSVLITIDDGAKGTGAHNGNKLIPLLEEYKMHATLFLIAGWWDISNYQSKYLEVQSHTYDMHKYGDCGKGQLVCANYENAKQDLQKSLDIIGNNTSFCYPFYSYDNEAIQAIKDLGFKVAFAGGNRDATRNSNKYLIPRYPIHSNITMDRFKEIVN